VAVWAACGPLFRELLSILSFVSVARVSRDPVELAIIAKAPPTKEIEEGVHAGVL